MNELGEDFHAEVNEFACVGAGLGGGFVDTSELYVMKYPEAMASKDKPVWDKAVVQEHDCMVEVPVFEPKLQSKVPADAKILTST